MIALAAIALGVAACAPAPVATPLQRGAGADEVGDPARGMLYAQQNCASCHAVSAGEAQSPNPEAQAFYIVANTPGMTRIALTVWLHTPHPTMPNLIIDPERIDDLSAYLATLKRSE